MVGKKRKICLALGTIYNWNSNKNSDTLINYCRKLDIDGLELTFGKIDELFAFKPSDENKRFLDSLDYVSIHAPFKIVRNSRDDIELLQALDKIQEIYNAFNCSNVVIHPDDFPRKDILDNYSLNVSIENLPPKKKFTISKLRTILKKDKKLRLCLDASHTYLWGKDECRKLVNAFSDRLSQVHLSGTYRNKDHRSMKMVTKRFLESIEPLRDIDAPIIIEESMKKRNINALREEIELVRKFFK